ncbi:MAG: hypothetical protein Fur002_08150 [Anaerolineales bacterium]
MGVCVLPAFSNGYPHAYHHAYANDFFNANAHPAAIGNGNPNFDLYACSYSYPVYSFGD